MGGIINTYLSWNGVLILNELMILIWLAFGFSNSWISIQKSLNLIKIFQFSLASMAVILTTYFYLRYEAVSQILLILAGVIYFGFLVYLMIKHPSERKTLVTSVILIMLAIIFFSAEFQVASTLISYAHSFVLLNIGHMKIPAGSLLSLESIFVVIGAFVIARIKILYRIDSIQTKLILGFLFGALAFSVLYSSTLFALKNPLSIYWIVLVSLLLGIGDVCLMPPIMAYIADNALTGYKGRLIAGMYFSLSLSGYLSGLIGIKIIEALYVSKY